jgi:hypothetical protein
VDDRNADAEDSSKRITTIYHIALDVTLLFIVVCVSIYIFRLLNSSLHTQIETYIAASQTAAKSPDHAPELVLDFTRAMDSAIVKSTVVFLGFVVTLLGTMYVLRAATASFSLGIKSGGQSGTLNTSSPGLVMVALGIITVAVALYSKTEISIKEGHGETANADSSPPNPEIVATGSVARKEGVVAAVALENQQRDNASVLVTAKTGGVVVELPPFAKASAELTPQQKELLQETAFTVLKIKGAEIHYSDVADSGMKPEDWSQLEAKRRSSVADYLKQLKPPPGDGGDWFNSHVEVMQGPLKDCRTDPLNPCA